jgi:transcriptional antiterminator NusG
MYDIERQELGTDQPLVEEAVIDDSKMGDLSGATNEPLAEPRDEAVVELPADEAVAEMPVEEAEGEVPADEAVAEGAAKPKDNRNWFVVHTYSGYENKVKANLERRIHSMGMQDKIFRVLVPMEDEVEFKDGKRKITPKKVFPGYVLVEMIMDDQSWYVVRNTQGVTGFVGSPGPGEKPVPLQDKEVKTILKQMGIEAPKLKIDFKKGDRVKVTSGPFFDFTGVVDEIAPEKERLRALISIFGRETPVELEFFQVEKV